MRVRLLAVPAIAFALAISATLPSLAGMSGLDWINRMEASRKKLPAASRSEPLWIAGQVRDVNLEDKELTVRHGAIPSANMPAMTMTFPVQDSAHLRMLKPGDQVEFEPARKGKDAIIMNVRMRH